MKSFDGLNYYEILQIPLGASYIEITRAYRDALSIYEEDALATYFLFSNNERDNILKTIENAFITLIDENKRAAYDRMLVDSGQVDESIIKKGQKKSLSLFPSQNFTSEQNLAERVRKKSEEKEIKKMSNEILSKELISGSDLKKLRKAVGLELFEIDAVTKISVTVLRSIEENQIENLPADIYLKNFLRSYAEILQIDSKSVVKGYLNNISNVQKK
jgi:curved DNA-binding protein CbpA